MFIILCDVIVTVKIVGQLNISRENWRAGSPPVSSLLYSLIIKQYIIRGKKKGWKRSSVEEGGLRGELNFVNGVFLRASHSALKAKPPG